MQVDRGPAVQRQRHPARVAQRVDSQQLGDPGAAGDVGLEHVDGAGVEHALEVRQVVAVLAGGDRHPGGRTVAEHPQPLEVVGGHRLLEPADGGVAAEALGELERLLARVRAVGVDEQLRLGPDRLARGAHPAGVLVGGAADLHLDPGDPALHPARKLLGQPAQRVRGEPAGSVDRHPVAHRTRAARRAAAPGVAPSDPRAQRRPRRSPSTRCPGGPGCGSSRPSPSTPPRATSRRRRGRRRPAWTRSASPSRRRRRCSRAPTRRPRARGRRRSSSSPTTACRRPRARRSGPCRPRPRSPAPGPWRGATAMLIGR